MLRSLNNLRHYTIGATDGEIGSVHDLFFDDQEWLLRYAVVDTGVWLSGRRVVVSCQYVVRGDWPSRRLYVNLTREQVRNSPDVDTDKPVSRQMQLTLAGYWAWPPTWEGQETLRPNGAVTPAAVTLHATAEEQGNPSIGEASLRSMREVTGYWIEATDGVVGHVEDFIGEEESWVIRYLVIDTRNWLPGKKVLIPPRLVKYIDWEAAKVYVDLTQEAIRSSPEYDPAAPVNRRDEVRFYDYHGRPKDWE